MDDPARESIPPPGPGGQPGVPTIDRMILTQARRTPDAVAIRQSDTTLTYRDLLEAAAPLARRLQAAGAAPEVCVAVCTRRTPDMVVAVLGILLSGGAYVPLDLGHPRQRLDAVLADARTGLVVGDEAGAALLAGSGRTIIPVWSRTPPTGPPPQAGGRHPRQPRETPPRAPASPPLAPAADNAAYVMYTSGSTGQPKGVVVTHRNVCAYIRFTRELLRLGPHSRSIGFAALGFDASVGDILVPLATGGSIQLLGEEDRIDPARLQRFLEQHRVTWGYLPPSLMPLLDPSRLPDLTDVISAGEPALPGQVARWSRPGHRRFLNWYGPTETTVSVTGAEFSGPWAEPLPIGRPLPGVRAHVLDERMRPCPPGVAGELCIGGVQVTRGYLGLPGRTAEVFVPDPVSGHPGARLYRTGDRAMWRDDGMLSYLGRIDRQVKIHGQRVEMGEIEAVLSRHPGIRQAVVDVVTTSGGTKQLVAYLTPADAPGHEAVRRHCARELPAFMVPTRVVRVADLPLTPAGKIDLRALREQAAAEHPPGQAPAASQAPERDSIPLQAVARAWGEVFEMPAPAPDVGFFACGGHSLLAMRLVATLRARTGRMVSVEDVFAGQTVAGLAGRLAAAPLATGEGAVPRFSAPRLSPAQRRIWFVEQIAPGTAAHNIPVAQRLRGPLDVATLRRALAATEQRQEVLRWRIRQRGGVPEVTVAPPGDVALVTDDLTGVPAGAREAALRDLLDREAATPLDLAAGPVWRARLIRLAADDHVLAVTVHHVVFDGTSIAVLCRDLARCYQPAAGPPKPAPGPLAHTFADYVSWLQARAEAAASRGDRSWWAEHLRDAPVAIDLPRDRARPAVQTFRGASVRAGLDPGTAASLRQIAAGAGATLFAALLAAFGYLVGRLAGADDLVIGTPLADRRELAFEPVVGLLLHIVPLRLRLPAGISFAELLHQSRDETAAAFSRADVPFDRIVESLGAPRDLSRNPLIQVLFNGYGNLTTAGLDVPGIAAEPIPPGLPGSLFDLTLYVNQVGAGTTGPGGLALEAVYNPDLYDAARVEALLASYVHLLGECAREPGRPLAGISLRPPGHGLPGWKTPLPPWSGPGIVERVLSAVRENPDAVAVSGPGGPLRYRDVEAVAAQVADGLRRAGLAPGDVVAVLAARDCRLPAVLLGVLAAGYRWMIVDPALPDYRIAQQAAAIRPRATLSDLPAVVAEPGWPSAPLPQVPSGARGYVMFTSGTTGDPAAVVSSELPLAHFAEWYPATFGLGRADRFAMLSGLSHDPVLRDMFVPLAAGARLCVPPDDLLRDPAALLVWLRSEQVTVAHLTPQLTRLIGMAPDLTAGPRLPLRLAALAGDQAGAADVAVIRALAPGARVVNFYGTTETPQAQAWHEPPPDGADDQLPAGHGVDGAVLLVLGAAAELATVGEFGEVVIRSRHLAEGYADPELTARKFGRTPGGDQGDRFFRTGDLGRYRADGAVVLAGRADDQLKIRGYRVECAEVEAALSVLPGVRQACVFAAGSGPDRHLVACAVPAGPTVRAAALIGELRRILPGYAVPAQVTLLPDLPLTAAGKVDRAAVLRAAGSDLVLAPPPDQGGALAGRSEQIIAGIWREVLGIPAVGPDDNFFDIGGHSLALAAVQARLAERMSRTVPVLDLFRHPTVRELAAHLNGHEADPVFERAAHRAAQRRRARRTSVPDAEEGATR